jgi:hypothetical protein
MALFVQISVSQENIFHNLHHSTAGFCNTEENIANPTPIVQMERILALQRVSRSLRPGDTLLAMRAATLRTHAFGSLWSSRYWRSNTTQHPRAFADARSYSTGALKYKPLEPARREIRLLYFKPQGPPDFENDDGTVVYKTANISFRDDDGTLCFSLRHVSLDDEPGYLPISYVWGDPMVTRCIKIDGHDFEVTVNLWEALSSFDKLVRSRQMPNGGF